MFRKFIQALKGKLGRNEVKQRKTEADKTTAMVMEAKAIAKKAKADRDAEIKMKAARREASPWLFHDAPKATAKRLTGKTRQSKRRRQRLAHRISAQRPCYG